jgi:hypothetical protein
MMEPANDSVETSKGFDRSGQNTAAGVPDGPKYPSYKSFDEFIDVQRLISLDEAIKTRIRAVMRFEDEKYFLNAFRLDAHAPYVPGAREVWLTRPTLESAEAYDMVDAAGGWKPSEEAWRFPELMDFIETLPFKTTGRILIIYDDEPRSVPAHRDHLNADKCNEFIWFRTSLSKPFYMLNHETGEKLYVDSYSAWFDAVNQFHGVDGAEGLNFSVRVDGVFSDEFRKRIPWPLSNIAATPAIWAAK